MVAESKNLFTLGRRSLVTLFLVIIKLKCSDMSFIILLYLSAAMVRVSTLDVLVAQRLGRRTFDPVVVGSIPSWDVIRAPRSTQPSIPPG